MAAVSSKSRCSVPARYIMVGLVHLGFAVCYLMRVNLSVAIVAMTNSSYSGGMSTARTDPECHGSVNVTRTDVDGEFNWDQETQGLILSAFFYGYLVTQLPAALFASKFGGKWIFGIGVLSTAVLSILTPVAARAGASYVVFIRFLVGFGEGVTFPAFYAMMTHWSPPFDKSKLASIGLSGVSSGTIIGYPVSGFLCKYGFGGGWPSVFYVFGICGIVWFLLWAVLAFDTPEVHPRISNDELKYILQSTADTVSKSKKRPKVPWMSVLMSVPFWSLAFIHFSVNWMLYTIITGLPTYLKDVLGFNIQENGLTSAFPFAFAFVCTICAGFFGDFLISRGILSVTAVRRLANLIGTFIPAAVLIGVTYLGCSDTVAAVVLMTFGVGIGGITTAGYSVNHLDIAPNFASILMAITNTGGTAAGCISPLVTGYFTQHEPTRDQWRKVFLVSAGLNFAGGLISLFFLSGKEQAWNHAPDLVEKITDESASSITPINDENVDETKPLLV